MASRMALPNGPTLDSATNSALLIRKVTILDAHLNKNATQLISVAQKTLRDAKPRFLVEAFVSTVG